MGPVGGLPGVFFYVLASDLFVFLRRDFVKSKSQRGRRNAAGSGITEGKTKTDWLVSAQQDAGVPQLPLVLPVVN